MLLFMTHYLSSNLPRLSCSAKVLASFATLFVSYVVLMLFLHSTASAAVPFQPLHRQKVEMTIPFIAQPLGNGTTLNVVNQFAHGATQVLLERRRRIHPLRLPSL